MKTLLHLLCFAFPCIINSQITFQKTIGTNSGDNGIEVLATADGGYLLGGNTLGFGSNFSKMYFIRLDQNGDTLWTKAYIGSNSVELNDVSPTTDGGFIATGRCTHAPAFDNDIQLLKMDANGEMEWVKTIGGVVDEQGYCVLQTSDGGYIISGWTTSYSSGILDIYIVKTDNAGELEWSQTYGGSAGESGYSVCENSDGSFLIGGNVRSTLSTSDAFVMQIASDGTLIWMKHLGDDGIYDITSLPDNEFIAIGYTNSFGNNYDVLVVKGNINGSIFWSKLYGGTSDDYGYEIENTQDDGFIITGFYVDPIAGADVLALKLNNDGVIAWAKTYGGPSDDRGKSVEVTSDGGFVFAGSTTSFGFGIGDNYIIKTNPDGESGCDEIIPEINETGAKIGIGDLNLTNASGGTSAIDVLTSASGGSILSLCSSVYVNETSITLSQSLYPNPVASGKNIFLNSELQGNFTLRLSHSSGKLVYERRSTLCAGKIEIELPLVLQNGYYILALQDEYGTTTNLPFVVE
jgi:hypothetical protein